MSHAPLSLASPVADLCDAFPDRVRILQGPFRAFTSVTAFSGPARLMALHGTDAALAALLASPGGGAVAVVGVGANPSPAVFGDGMAKAAEANGWAGVVIDGALRDAALIRDRNVGVLARGTWPAIARGAPEGREVPALRAAGANLTTGDWIAADEDGVIALDAGLAQELRG